MPALKGSTPACKVITPSFKFLTPAVYVVNPFDNALDPSLSLTAPLAALPNPAPTCLTTPNIVSAYAVETVLLTLFFNWPAVSLVMA